MTDQETSDLKTAISLAEFESLTFESAAVNVAAYLRKTLAGLSVPAQRDALKMRGEEFDWNLIFYGYENGADCDNGVKRDRGLNEFLIWARHRALVRIQGVMFWHAGHIAGSLSGFIKALQLIDEYGMEWYIENPRT